MKTLVKLLGTGAIVAVIYSATRKKTPPAGTTTTTVTPGVQMALDSSPFENKLIVQDNGQWFVVHNGKRWYTGSVQAIKEFQKEYPGNDTPIENVSELALTGIPIAGKLLDGLVYQENQLSMPVYGLGVDRGFCTKKNSDGSNTIYGESMTSGNPCPRGGSLIVKKTSFTGI